MEASAPDPLLGRSIAGKFAIESLIGRGAMGSVYKARQVALDKFVAIKVMRDDTSKDLAYAARFQREARAASRLDHPNSIQVIDYGEEPDGLLYIAMEYLDGVDLFRVIEDQGALPAARVVDILSQVLAALAVEHDTGVVHRDLKPENIMVLTRADDEGRPRDLVKVCDFGIAKILDVEPRPAQREGVGRAATTQGLVVGTPEYMSPEQCRGEALDARADLYSVGVILYQLLVGRVPFEGNTPIDVVVKHVAEEPTPPSKIDPRVSPKLEAVCLKAMRKKRDERHASAREMRAELRAAVEGVVEALPSEPRGPSLSRERTSGAETMPALAAPPPRPPLAGRAIVAASVVVVGLAAVGITLRVRGGISRAASSPSALAQATAAPPSAVPSSAPVASTLPSPGPSAAPPPATRDRQAPRPTPPPPNTAVIQPSPAPSPTMTAAVAVAAPAPPPVVSAVPAPTPVLPPTTAPVAAAPPPFDPSKGRVVWSVAGAGGGATQGNVARALAHAGAAWQTCYQAGLRSRGARVEGSATLRLTCDDEGRVVGAAVSGTDMTDVASCIRGAALGATVPNADTGQAWATISLTLQAPQ